MTEKCEPLSDGSLRQCCVCFELIQIGAPIARNKHQVEMHAACAKPGAGAPSTTPAAKPSEPALRDGYLGLVEI